VPWISPVCDLCPGEVGGTLSRFPAFEKMPALTGAQSIPKISYL
jgi:hypothetical protein